MCYRFKTNTFSFSAIIRKKVHINHTVIDDRRPYLGITQQMGLAELYCGDGFAGECADEQNETAKTEKRTRQRRLAPEE